MRKNLPKLSFHKIAKVYYLKIQGKFIYLGKDENEAERQRILILNKMIASEKNDPPVSQACQSNQSPTVDQVVTCFLDSVKNAKRKKLNFSRISCACKLLSECFGNYPINKIGKRQFKVIKEEITNTVRTLSTAKDRLVYIKKVFEISYE